MRHASAPRDSPTASLFQPQAACAPVRMSSRKLLERLGGAALRPTHVDGRWRKAAVSAKNAARLRKEDLLAGKEWPWDTPPKEVPVKAPKGHKRHRVEEQRQLKIQENMAGMDEKIVAYRESKKIGEVSLVDQILLTPREIREKLKAKK